MLRKKNKGITLVGLVVTIVVLLILAGISISALTNTVIFQKAKDAKQKSEDASEKEQSLLYEYEDELSKYTSNDRWDGKVNKPEIMTGMTAIKFTEPTGNTEDTKGKEEKVSDSSKNDWYNYSEKKWANAQTEDGSMWVWIPRYAYKINKSNQTFDVVFLVGTTDNYYDKDGKLQTAKRQTSETDIPDATKDYVVHPAFTNESSIGYANGGWRKELTGIWISKFEAGYVDKDTFNANKAKYTSSVNYTQVTGYTPAEKYEDASNYLNGIYGSNATKITYPTFQGGKYSMNYINHSDAFSISRALTDSNNIYKLSNKETDSHLIKNSEWGAVVYLSHSKYGTCTDGTCKEVNINNSSSYYTGRSGGSPSASSSTEGTYKYNDIYNKTTTMTGGTTITPTVTNDTTYPWTSSNGLYKSSNQGKDSTTTNLKFSFTAPTNNTYLSFDWSVSSERYDYLYYTITKDGTTLSDTGTSTKIGGTSLGTTESSLTYNSVSKKLDKGTYELTFTYRKDSSDAKGTDTGYIKNIKVLDSPTVNVTKILIGEGKDGPSASTTHNIYGVYDMSGGAYESTMGNMVSNDGTTMMSGDDTEYNSGYTGKVYDFGNYTSYTGIDYPNNKYYDKYSFSTSSESRIRSKLGDGIKEVYKGDDGWYSDFSRLAFSYVPWFSRGGIYSNGTVAGVFDASGDKANADSNSSSRLVITP